MDEKITVRDAAEPLSQFEDVNGPHPKLWAEMRRAYRKAKKMHIEVDGYTPPHKDWTQDQLNNFVRSAHLDGIVRGLVAGCAAATGTPAQRFYELLADSDGAWR